MTRGRVVATYGRTKIIQHLSNSIKPSAEDMIAQWGQNILNSFLMKMSVLLKALYETAQMLSWGG